MYVDSVTSAMYVDSVTSVILVVGVTGAVLVVGVTGATRQIRERRRVRTTRVMPAEHPQAGMRRRRFLAAVPVAAAAGCVSDDSDDTSDGLAGGTLGDDEQARDDDAPTASNGSADARNESGDTNATPAADDQPIHQGYETTTVRVLSPDGTQLGQVTAAIADTPNLRYTGLSNTDSLPADRGMLFVYDRVGDHNFFMRKMDFGIDIVYADDEGVITGIQHAPEPGPDEDGSEQYYPGRGQYVLEVVRDWTTDRGVTEGDRLTFVLDDRRVGGI